jgi:hypothetical protein
VTFDEVQTSGKPLARPLEAVIAEVRRRQATFADQDLGDYVGSELPAVHRVLSRIRRTGLAKGPIFCEWGSGLGGVCGVAALNGFSAVGIEIQGRLVAAARLLANELSLPITFAEGTFLLPGDEDLTAGTSRTGLLFETTAWDELELVPEDCDVVFAYPWPGEESCVDQVFARHASPDALLVTFHDWDYLLVQRKLADPPELLTLGWM